MAQYGGRHKAEGTRYATRTAMVLAEYLRALGHHSEANWIYMKAHFMVRTGLGLPTCECAETREGYVRGLGDGEGL